MFISLQPHGLHNPWNSPGQNTGTGSFSLLQEIFLTQGSNPGLVYCWRTFYQQNHQGSLRILEWVAYPFSSGSSCPRNWTRGSCIAGGFFNNWATREALYSVQFSRSVMSNSFVPHEPQHARLPCLSPTPRVHPNPCPLSWWRYLSILSSAARFSFCLPSSLVAQLVKNPPTM